jgi:hypothetical protein
MNTKKKRSDRKCICAVCWGHPRSKVAKEHRAINRVLTTLNEKSRRRFVDLLALQWGRSGIECLSQITGLSRPTIRRGRDEVQRVERGALASRVRRAGAGRPGVEKNTPLS